MPSYDPRKKPFNSQRGIHANDYVNENDDDDDDDDEGADDVSVPFDRASGTSSVVVNSNTLERVFSLPVSGTQKTKSISSALANKLLNLHEQVLVSKGSVHLNF